MDDKNVPVFRQDEYMSRFRDSLPVGSGVWRAFYSSIVGGITRDPALMMLPIDDHMVHRGHAVFDTCNVRKDRAYGLDFHLDRLLKSAATASIDHSYSKESLQNIILATIAAGGRKGEGDGFAKFWLSAGRGDFGISPRGCTGAAFYVMVMDFHGHPQEGIEEFTVGTPLKPPLLASCKTTNYLLNALTAMEAQERGGLEGIQLKPDGNIGETSIGNVAIVDESGVFKSPPYDGTILAGTTLRQAFAHAPKLREDGLIEDFGFRPVHSTELATAKEVMIFGGGGVVSVTSVDGNPIGQSTGPGPVARSLRQNLVAEMEGEEFTHDVPWKQYDQLPDRTS